MSRDVLERYVTELTASGHYVVNEFRIPEMREMYIGISRSGNVPQCAIANAYTSFNLPYLIVKVGNPRV